LDASNNLSDFCSNQKGETVVKTLSHKTDKKFNKNSLLMKYCPDASYILNDLLHRFDCVFFSGSDLIITAIKAVHKRGSA